jgi:hypothetical protein
MEKGTVLKEDFEFEYAKAKSVIVEARQNGIRIFPAGRITSYSDHHVAINGKVLHRHVNEFVVIE